MSNKHTQGPWRIWNLNNNTVVAGEIGKAIVMAECSPAFISGEAAIANAKLISAAPELLEALEQVLDDLSSSTMKFPDFGVCEAAWDQAIEAIKKAGGEYE